MTGSLLRKEFTQSASATSGLTAYSLERGTKKTYPEMLAGKKTTDLLRLRRAPKRRTKKFDYSSPLRCAKCSLEVLIKGTVADPPNKRYVAAHGARVAGNLHRLLKTWGSKLADQISRRIPHHRIPLASIKEVRHLTDKMAKAGGYNPDEPRDSGGKWTTAGTGYTKDKQGNWKDAKGKAAPKKIVDRINELKLPPAWTDVRVNPDFEGGHQAVGRDAKGTNQPRYSAEHDKARDEKKFAKLRGADAMVGKMLGEAQNEMFDKSLEPYQRDTAAVTALMIASGFRVASDTETKGDVKAYGASNMLSSMVKVNGSTMTFNFTGKHGVEQNHVIVDAKLAKYISSKQASLKASDELFDAPYSDIAHYVDASTEGKFTPKDIRMWVGTGTAVKAVKSMPAPKNATELKKAINEVASIVGERLGNKPTQALKSYIDPHVFKAWKDKLGKSAFEYPTGYEELSQLVKELLDQYPDEGKTGKANLRGLLRKEERDVEEIVDAIMEEIDTDNMSVAIAEQIKGELEGAFKEAGVKAYEVAGLSVDTELFSKDAEEYAQYRSAELVGMTWDEETGKYVPNPDPEMSITETTRDALKDLTTAAVQEGWGAAELSKAIESSNEFSEARATTIARTELSNSYNQGNMKAWQDSGVVTHKEAILADTHPEEDECDDAADQGPIPIDEPFDTDDGDDAPPFHPNCMCGMVGYSQEEVDAMGDEE